MLGRQQPVESMPYTALFDVVGNFRESDRDDTVNTVCVPNGPRSIVPVANVVENRGINFLKPLDVGLAVGTLEGICEQGYISE